MAHNSGKEQGMSLGTVKGSPAEAGHSGPIIRRRILLAGIALATLGLVLCAVVLYRLRHRPEPVTNNSGAEVRVQRVQAEAPVGPALARQEMLAGLAACAGQGFPGNLPWAAIRQIAVRREQEIEKIIAEHPTEFLQMCLDRYDQEVKGYSCVLVKRERVNGKLKPREVVQAYFREHPFSVFMDWKEGAGKAKRVLFVRGENNDQMLARPAGVLQFSGVWARDVDSPDARASGRYLIDQFGIKLGTERTLQAMRSAEARHALHVRYDGIFRVPEVGDRLCYKLVRTPYDPLEDEGLNELTLYIDVETWLQVGSILRDSQGKLIAEYFFRDVKLNPTFKPDQFKRSSL